MDFDPETSPVPATGPTRLEAYADSMRVSPFRGEPDAAVLERKPEPLPLRDAGRPTLQPKLPLPESGQARRAGPGTEHPMPPVQGTAAGRRRILHAARAAPGTQVE